MVPGLPRSLKIVNTNTSRTLDKKVNFPAWCCHLVLPPDIASVLLKICFYLHNHDDRDLVQRKFPSGDVTSNK